ncbi:hypothetical protein RI845_00730 [Thalassotalea nanhaiensis]|uniref:Uncharacterized protein n=1 Tax=Thalassotalea nanhaiensis TaxID=3065648 RepID=A0ABY9TIR0_9GAMM|nr:hypothetical protein RI845_00730 [Colwelliaceae bacterium SQ345]
MFNMTKKQCKLLGDVGGGVGILVLAWLLKDADPEGKQIGMMTVFFAILIRFSGPNFLRSTNRKCK